MSSLKAIRNRIKSVKSTKKITSAMKMIAATKLRRAEESVVASRPYADMMSQMITELLNNKTSFETPPRLLTGTGKDNVVLVILVSSDRGLCGGFNGGVARAAMRFIEELEDRGKTVKIICIGRRGRDILRYTAHNEKIIESYNASDQPKFYQIRRIAKLVMTLFDQGQFDRCVMFYNRFHSVMLQTVTQHQLIPYTPLAEMEKDVRQGEAPRYLRSLYEYEPSESVVLERLLPNNFEVQLYRGILENCASEHGARMTAMDSATRNANDMIERLNLSYNRTRQAIVTNELSEIVAGAEAL